MKHASTLVTLCVGALLTIGTVMLYSAEMGDQAEGLLIKQLVWCTLGIAICWGIALCDYRWLKTFGWAIFAVSIISLALVLHPDLGNRVNGARRWFVFGGVSFQPSELGKLALVIALAWYGDKYQRHMHEFWRGLVIPGCMIAVTLGLIFVEPDRGTTILLGTVALVMLLVAGVRWRFLVPPMIASCVALTISLLLDPVRSRRIVAWLDPEKQREGDGYQVWQSLLGLGSGGLEGLGLGNGRQKLGFLPEHKTDFIFAVLGEELGLVATFGVVVVFMLLVLCGIYIAWHAWDHFGLLLGCGISFLIGLQAIINIAVVTNTVPNKGIPLPFISYGGSNLLVMFASVGLLLSIARCTEDSNEVVQAPLGRPEFVPT